MCNLKSIPDGYFWQSLLEHCMEKDFWIVNPSRAGEGGVGGGSPAVTSSIRGRLSHAVYRTLERLRGS